MLFTEEEIGKRISPEKSELLKRNIRSRADFGTAADMVVGTGSSTIRDVTYRYNILTRQNLPGMNALAQVAYANADHTTKQGQYDKDYMNKVGVEPIKELTDGEDHELEELKN